MDSLAQFIEWSTFRHCLLFATTLAGAIISQMLSLHKNLEGCTPFLKKAYPKKSNRNLVGSPSAFSLAKSKYYG